MEHDDYQPTETEQAILTGTPAPTAPACRVCQDPLDEPLPAARLCGKVSCAEIVILGLPF